MIVLAVIVLGMGTALFADDNEGMQGFGVGVAAGAFVVGAIGWLS